MSHAPFALGQLIADTYRVEHVIGRGAMGTVVQAVHAVLGHRVAIKVLTIPGADDAAIERFVQEARVAAHLPGDHVCRVTDVGRTTQGQAYFVMELLQGNDLDQELKKRERLPVKEAVDLVLQACEGVADAHAIGLVHRDLKPANIFLVKRPKRAPIVKVLDFGLSKVPQALRGKTDSLTVTNSTFGTPQYMSPEQVQSTRDVDARSDQHALALVLYELVTGVPAFDAAAVVDLMVKICVHDAPPLRQRVATVPEGLEAVVARALRKKPAERFPSLVELAAALAPFGGPGAAASAANVAASLGAGKDSANLSSRRPAPPELPLAESGTDFTSSDDPPRRRALSIGLAVAGAVAGVLAGLALFVLEPWAPAPPTSAASEAAAPPASAATEALLASAEVQPTVAPATPAEDAPAPAVPPVDAASASASARARTPDGHAGAKPASTGKKGRSGLQVFGGSRK